MFGGFGFISDEDIAKQIEKRAKRRAAANLDAARSRCATLLGFIKEFWHILEPATVYVEGEPLRAIAAHLEAVTRGEIVRLVMNVPPGTSKSLSVGVFWPAWEWGPRRMPWTTYLAASFAEPNAIRDNDKMRRLVTSELYQMLFPHVKLRRSQNAKKKFENTAGGGRECRAMAGLTGGRAMRLIIDDPHSTEQADSDNQRSEAVKIFEEGSSDRLSDISTSAIIIIMQRLHEQDLTGAILRKIDTDPYVHLVLPMEFDPDNEKGSTPWYKDPRRFEGQLLFPERFPAEALAKLKSRKGSYAWASQYQQRPSPRSGSFIKVELIGEVKAVPPGTGRRARGWDLAATSERPGSDPDYTAGVRMTRIGDKFYIDHVIRFRATAGRVRAVIKATAERDDLQRATQIFIPKDPGQAGKDQSESYVKMLAGHSVKSESARGEKTVRAEPFASQVEAGNVYLVRTGRGEDDAWIDDYLSELRAFPAGHDDQLDATADAFKLLTGATTQGWFDYMAEMLAKQRGEALEADKTWRD